MDNSNFRFGDDRKTTGQRYTRHQQIEDQGMRVAFIVLAFCSSLYVGIGCLAIDFLIGWTPQTYIALAVSVCFIASSLLAIRNVNAALVLSWGVSIVYIFLSWRMDAPWVFRQNIERFALWTPIFLSIAGLSVKKKEQTVSLSE